MAKDPTNTTPEEGAATTATATATVTATEVAATNNSTETWDVKRFLSSMRLDADGPAPVPMVSNDLQTVDDTISDSDRFVSGMAAVLMNIDPSAGKFDKGAVQSLIARIDELITLQLNAVIHNEQFKAMECQWLALYDLIQNTNFKADVVLDILDVSKDELYMDFDSNSVDITGSALFKKVYISEKKNDRTGINP